MPNIVYIPFSLCVQILSNIFPYILEIHSLYTYTKWYRLMSLKHLLGYSIQNRYDIF